MINIATVLLSHTCNHNIRHKNNNNHNSNHTAIGNNNHHKNNTDDNDKSSLRSKATVIALDNTVTD